MTATLSRFGNKYVLTFAIGIATFAGIASITGCHKAPDADVAANDSGPDPADANMAPVDGTQQQPVATPVRQSAPARVLSARQQNESQQNAEEYPQTGGPTDPQTQAPNQDNSYDPNYESQVDAGQQALEADTPPPPLPTYQQPEAPGPNYLWTPGYWGYSPVGYYWVPGAWVFAPYPGALWTPAYWGFFGNRYRFYNGYWGPHIGFYGGINYGFGYTGSGYHGGYWNGNNFYYNRAVNRVNVTRITNVYNRTVVVNNNYNRVSYNGGRGGIPVRPQPAEIAAMRGPRTPPMSAQIQNQRQAAENRQQFYSQNKGRPAIVASPRPFAADRGVTPVARPVPVNLPLPNRPNNPQLQPNRPAQPQVQPVRPAQQQLRPGEYQVRPVNPTPPQARAAQPQIRPTPQQELAKPQPEARPTPQPQLRPTPQPQQEMRPTPQPQYRPVPESQPRPVPQAQPQTQQMQRPQPTEHPVQRTTPEVHPQPQSQQRSAPQPKAQQAPHEEGHPH
jgi:hypothetical protein